MSGAKMVTANSPEAIASALNGRKPLLIIGEEALKAEPSLRKELANMNTTFTTRVVGVVPETDKSSPAWRPGEVEQYRNLLTYTHGTNGTLLVKTPLEWAFRRDPHDTGIVRRWASQPVDLAIGPENSARGSVLKCL